MENEKTLEELKQQCMQQYGLTEEQLDNILAAISKLWEYVKEIAETMAAALSKFVAENPAIDWQELIEQIRGEIKAQEPPTYNRTDTRNGYYSAKLKNYKNKIGSAAIRKPRGVARSCC